jgi:hypothetical protein
MNGTRNGGRRRLWQWLDAFAVAFVCLAAYQVTLAEVAAEEWTYPRPAPQDVRVSMADASRVAAGAAR